MRKNCFAFIYVLILNLAHANEASKALQDKMQSEVEDDPAVSCQVKLYKKDYTSQTIDGPKLKRIACYKFAEVTLKESGPEFVQALVKHQGQTKILKR